MGVFSGLPWVAGLYALLLLVLVMSVLAVTDTDTVVMGHWQVPAVTSPM